MNEFERTYNSLNELQRQAVDTIDGPVLVIAGPGTGKTQLLSSRVANILNTTDTQPQNILCLTFTNKAAVNMKERIIAQAGAAGAKVAASTFHSFSAEIMNLYPDNFWNAAHLAVAPDTVQLDVIESIVSKLPLNNPLALKFAGQYTLLSAIQQGISLAKRAGLTPDKLRAIIDFNLKYIDEIEPLLVDICSERLSVKTLSDLQTKIGALPEQQVDELIAPLISLSTVLNESLLEAVKLDEEAGKCTNTSKWKSRWLQTVDGEKKMINERDRNYWWLKLADVYEAYRDELHSRSFYDYDDMLVEVITQLEQNPQIRADVQERFAYVLIDEFQDTTPAQLRLAHLVADHFSAEGRPNIMAVGDDDQSIYKFNGAELNNMLGFKRSYPAAEIIILTDNYRSTQAVLDSAKKIIEQADSRLVNADPALSKNLIAKNPPAVGVIEAKAFASQELQYSLTAREIARNFKPDHHIAVLARSHSSLIAMASILQELDIPVRYEQASNILDHDLIDQTYMLARLILAIRDGHQQIVNATIHKIVRWPAWGLEPLELWQLALSLRGKNWLDGLLAHSSPGLQAMGQWFIDLAASADEQPLIVTVEQIIGLRPTAKFTSPVKDYLTRNREDINGYLHSLSAIQLLRSLVREFSDSQQPTLTEFVRFIEINKDNGVVVADESPFVTGNHSVQLLTVHKAKGLEFDHVYIVDAIEDNWQPRNGGRKPPANLPLQPPLDDFDDYVRLMYVAATRAKSSLTITSFSKDHSGREVATSTIIQSAFDVQAIDSEDRAELITALEESLTWPALSGGQEKEMLKAKLDSYSLFATHLSNFMDVSRGGPEYFKERHLLYLPEIETASMAYGTAMHAALEAAQKQVNAGDFSMPAVELVFAKALKERQLIDSDYTRYLAQGKATIKKLFNDFGMQLAPGSVSEQSLRDIMVGSARIGGTIDRVDHDAGGLLITDYKTGKPLIGFGTKDKNQAIRAYKHKLQLVFYALLLAEGQNTGTDNIKGQMVYVEAETARDLIRGYAPSGEDIERLRKLIAAVWSCVQSLDLPDISGYSLDIDGILAFEEDLIKNARA